MTMDQECKFALVEFGESDNKTGYVIVKGGYDICKEPTKAHTYWYPDNITNEEAQQEVNDLMEHYENVAIVVPLPEHINIEILRRYEGQTTPIDRPDSEVSA